MLDETVAAIMDMGPRMVAYAIAKCDCVANSALHRERDLTALRALELKQALETALSKASGGIVPALA